MTETQTAMFDAFDEQLAKLFAAYDKPNTNARRSAYREGLSKLSAIELTRLVEHCLGENGPDSLPTPAKLWQIRRELRRAARPRNTQSGSDAVPLSTWAVKANLAMLKLAYFDRRRGFEPIAEYEPPPERGYGHASFTQATMRDRSRLDEALRIKNLIVADAEDAEAAGTPWSLEDFADVLVTALEKVLGTRADVAA